MFTATNKQLQMVFRLIENLLQITRLNY